MSAAWVGWLGLMDLIGEGRSFIAYDLSMFAWCAYTIGLLYTQYCHKLTHILAGIQCGYAFMIACYTCHIGFDAMGYHSLALPLEPVYNNWGEVAYVFTAMNLLAFAWRWLNVERVAGKSQSHSADSYSGVQRNSSVLANQQTEEGA